jgi:hypothetical protein
VPEKIDEDEEKVSNHLTIQPSNHLIVNLFNFTISTLQQKDETHS